MYSREGENQKANRASAAKEKAKKEKPQLTLSNGDKEDTRFADIFTAPPKLSSSSRRRKNRGVIERLRSGRSRRRSQHGNV
jgi:hypothetical protein